ncbi:hypothetical protein [Cupriavidus sp. D39]|uniref:hypothetical protein n=1 Tax=Cupriavidus sp. D39 TaxID=2997877 RepID=UPI00226F3329|nr:hypothetical protein [Cupriavidus sp. D39]MCY0853558.1 hypothetical protein [Cupriavidus sp. D39]
MHKPITSRLARKGINSLEALARELIQIYPSEFAELEARSLSARIGALNKGNPVWWEKRPEQLKCLLELSNGLLHQVNPSCANPQETFFGRGRRPMGKVGVAICFWHMVRWPARRSEAADGATKVA